jgi:hypothetical protein
VKYGKNARVRISTVHFTSVRKAVDYVVNSNEVIVGNEMRIYAGRIVR